MITVIGSINMDVIVRTARHPLPGETLLGNDLRYLPGGKGANQAVAAARAGGQVRLVARTGQDAFGIALRDFMSTEAVHLDFLHAVPAVSSGVAIITVSASGENTIVVISGANAHLTPQATDSVPFAVGDIVVAQLEIPLATVAAAFQVARQHGAKTLLNPSPAAPLPTGLLADCDVLVLNEVELAAYTERDTTTRENIIEAARTLRVAPSQIIVVTLGSRGVLAVADQEVIHVAALPVTVVDTTGAGDCFGGALAAALSEAQPLHEALHFANAAAALSVQTVGAAAAMPNRAAIMQRLHTAD